MREEIFNSSIQVLDLSCRSYNALMRSNISTVHKLVSVSKTEGGLSNVKGIGSLCAMEIEAKLDALFGETNTL